MKSIKTATAALLALALAGTGASAQTTIHIAGSTAFRASATAAIKHAIGTNLTYAYNGANVYKAGAAIFSGTLVSTGAPVVIKTFWTGSAAGVVDLVSQRSITGFIDSGTVTLSSTGTIIANGYTKESSPIQAAFTDAFQSSVAPSVATASLSGSVGSYTTAAALANGINSAPLVDAGAVASAVSTIGVVPFEWVLGKNSTGAVFTNITQQSAYALIQGATPLSFFTGGTTSNDQFKYVFLIGRNEDSGTRIVDLAEPQGGFGQSATQYQLGFANNTANNDSFTMPTGGSSTSVTTINLWPTNWTLNTEPNMFWLATGHSGYIGGGDVGNALSANNPVTGLSLTGTITGSGTATWHTPVPTPSGYTGAYFVGYLGVADAQTPIGNGGTLLSYNGVPFSVQACQTGLYSMWGFEHLYYFGSGIHALSGAAQQAMDDVADLVYSTYAPTNSSGVTDPTQAQLSSAGILFDSNFRVTRSVEGGQISQNY